MTVIFNTRTSFADLIGESILEHSARYLPWMARSSRAMTSEKEDLALQHLPFYAIALLG
ncbi:MAG: hypothetical protein AAF562_07025 [Pseudomonadota bacterium]